MISHSHPRLLRRRLDPHRDDGFVMVNVLMLIAILGVFTLIIAGSNLISNLKTRGQSQTIASRAAAEAALADALTTANTGTLGSTSSNTTTDPALTSFIPTGKPGRSQSTSTSAWAWWAEPRGTTAQSYLVHAIGQSTSSGAPGSVRLDATLTGLAVTGTTQTSGATSYLLAPRQGSAAAVTTRTETTLNSGNTTLAGYTPGTSTPDTEPVPLAVAGTYNATGLAQTPSITLYNWAQEPQPERCRGAGCDQAVSYNDAVDFTTTAISNQFATSCYDTAHRDWTASEAAGTSSTATLPAGSACYDNVTFDRNTTVTGTPATPTVLYVRGSVTVMPGVSVNAASTSPYSAQLQILSSASTPVTIQAGSQTNQTSAAWQLWAPNATCTVTGNGPVSLYGSITCNRFAPTGPVALLFDRSAAATPITVPATSTATVWQLGTPQLASA